MKTRCPWSLSAPIYIKYHDEEWGVPLHNDQALFEFLILEGMQAGLSWLTVLKKREHFRKVFDQFEAKKIAQYRTPTLTKLLKDPGIIRNRMKVNGAVKNARAFLEVQNKFGSFNDYIWQFTDGKTIHNEWKTLKQVPASTKQSDAMSKDLKKRGFTFVGTTICYAFMQAVGIVNDHLVDCFRYEELR